MVKLRTTVIAVALFCLFTFSLAGTQPNNDEAATQVSLPPSEAAIPSPRLPSEAVNTETDSNFAVVSPLPLTKIFFRPVNRRFHVREQQTFRHHFRFYGKMRENYEIPYGNDMLVSSGENSDFQEPDFHKESRGIPGRWMRMHRRRHHDERDSDNEDQAKNIVFNKVDSDRFDREKKLKKSRKRFRNEEEQKRRKVVL